MRVTSAARARDISIITYTRTTAACIIYACTTIASYTRATAECMHYIHARWQHYIRARDITIIIYKRDGSMHYYIRAHDGSIIYMRDGSMHALYTRATVTTAAAVVCIIIYVRTTLASYTCATTACMHYIHARW